jgi:hypothetical protein
VKDFVDVNGNNMVDINDYIDENRNKTKDPLEGFSTHPISGALMSPYLNSVPVFCCDGELVMVELWGEDKSGNRNFCWNWVRLEDKTSVDYLLPFNQTYTCAQERPLIDLLSKAGTYSEGTPEYAAAVTLFKEDVTFLRGHLCSPISKQIVVTPSLKCNGPGTITVSWRLTKQAAKGAALHDADADADGASGERVQHHVPCGRYGQLHEPSGYGERDRRRRTGLRYSCGTGTGQALQRRDGRWPSGCGVLQDIPYVHGGELVPVHGELYGADELGGCGSAGYRGPSRGR